VGAAFEPALGAPILVPSGEAAKTPATVTRLHEAFLEAGLRRGGTVVAIGGGTVGDVAGFAAATYMRGVDWVVAPTTLLSMVDSSIGGKVGVNHPRAKNLIGAFHQPRAVFIDPDLLATLPDRELQSGAYEILKCGLIGDASLFAAVTAAKAPAHLWSRRLMERAIAGACRLKARVVSRDEREGGLRRVLNLGHTLGHALEAATVYRRFTHGEAVGAGILYAAFIARGRRLLTGAAADAIRRAVEALGSRPRLASLDWEIVRAAMRGDKKARSARPTFVLPRGIGHVVVTEVEEPELLAAWAYLRDLERPRAVERRTA
jgi:3-dehydroquinate synthase